MKIVNNNFKPGHVWVYKDDIKYVIDLFKYNEKHFIYIREYEINTSSHKQIHEIELLSDFFEEGNKQYKIIVDTDYNYIERRELLEIKRENCKVI